jgi:hypothetical protein
MKKLETITNNIIKAILWAEVKPFDPSFQGEIVKETASQGFNVVVKHFSNYFEEVTHLDTTSLPENIATALGSDYALLTEEYFITSNGLNAKTDVQIFTAKTVLKALENKTVYLLKKKEKNNEK